MVCTCWPGPCETVTQTTTAGLRCKRRHRGAATTTLPCCPPCRWRVGWRRRPWRTSAGTGSLTRTKKQRTGVLLTGGTVADAEARGRTFRRLLTTSTGVPPVAGPLPAVRPCTGHSIGRSSVKWRKNSFFKFDRKRFPKMKTLENSLKFESKFFKFDSKRFPKMKTRSYWPRRRERLLTGRKTCDTISSPENFPTLQSSFSNVPQLTCDTKFRLWHKLFCYCFL